MNDTNLAELFAEHVKLVSKKYNYSINGLADRAHVSRGYLSDVLRCKKIPTLNTIARLAKALEIEPWVLLRPRRQPGWRTLKREQQLSA